MGSFGGEEAGREQIEKGKRRQFDRSVAATTDDNGEVLARAEYEAKKRRELRHRDIRMISGCEDWQTSADVDNISSFQLPDPCGRSGGALTSTLLRVLYADERRSNEDLSYTEVLEKTKEYLRENGYEQIPQLSSTNPIDVKTRFDLVPDTKRGTKRAVMIGINYVGDDPGELSGCWNDVGNMKKYIMDVHGFEEENIVVLLDDGKHTEPTYENIINAYKSVVSQSEDGDCIFLHYSGHGTKIRDDGGDEGDGYDEALCPRDFQSAGMIRDDDLFDVLVKPLSDGVHMVSLMDCCHSGSVMDLPYVFKPDSIQTEMDLNPGMKSSGVFASAVDEDPPFRVGSVMDIPYVFKSDSSQTEMDLNPGMKSSGVFASAVDEEVGWSCFAITCDVWRYIFMPPQKQVPLDAVVHLLQKNKGLVRVESTEAGSIVTQKYDDDSAVCSAACTDSYSAASTQSYDIKDNESISS